jgi:hypothetical protein
MTFPLCSAKLRRTVVTTVAVLAMGASATPASAVGASPAPAPHQFCEGVTRTECERQVLASRGVGAPAPATVTAPSSDAGFDWGAALVGAGAIVLLWLATPAVAIRRRQPSAR